MSEITDEVTARAVAEGVPLEQWELDLLAFCDAADRERSEEGIRERWHAARDAGDCNAEVAAAGELRALYARQLGEKARAMRERQFLAGMSRAEAAAWQRLLAEAAAGQLG